ncbi:MAG: methyltransferase domain-containing protein [Planctomycetia bacterium]|nr:methyltransferase domain-containing protein [Planctomycetia bacterium]
MNNIPLDKLDKTFGRVTLHQRIGNIILEQSTNQNPIGTIVYKGISFNDKIKIADIGCGYGRCINYLSEIVPNDSEYIGIDPLDSNRTTFLNTAKTAGFSGKYICGNADRISEYPDNYFDLILCNYSLYFFIDTLPGIVKKLKSDGLFITITHSTNSLKELLQDLQIVLNIDHKSTWDELGSEQVLDNFNAENGFELLQPYFNKIEKIDYFNTLEFQLKDINKLFNLLQFKKTSLIQHNDYVEFIKTNEFDDKLREIISAKINKVGKYVLNKDDTIFRCRLPK